jgi:hypothetical protein
MTYRVHYAIAAGLLLSWCGLVQGAIYKWVDDHGTTNYSQHPPPAQDPVKVVVSPPPSGTEAAQAQKRLESQLETVTEQREAREKAGEEKAKSAAENKQRRDNCAKARGNLTGLTSGGRKRIIGADGAARYLTDDEHQKLLTETRKQIDEYCD